MPAGHGVRQGLGAVQAQTELPAGGEDAWRRGHGLQASALAAPARTAHRFDGHMPEFARQPGGAGDQLAADDESAAHTVGQAHVQQIGDAVGAGDRLGESGQSGVVVDDHGRVEAFGEGRVDPVRSRSQNRRARGGAGPGALFRRRVGTRDADADALKCPVADAGLGAQPVDECQGEFGARLPGRRVVVADRPRDHDLVRSVGDSDVDPPVPEVDAHELRGRRVEREALGRPSAAPSACGVLVQDDDGSSLEEVAGDLGKGRAGQADEPGDLAAAHGTVRLECAQHAVFMGPPHQGVRSCGLLHTGQGKKAETFRQLFGKSKGRNLHTPQCGPPVRPAEGARDSGSGNAVNSGDVRHMRL
ncbi:hypothetical protein SGPA1_41101 [Streptomyces misionensis JCM 4497]